MICYLDTSALVKLYVQEEGSDQVSSLVDCSIVIATCKIAFAESGFCPQLPGGDYRTGRTAG